MTGESKLLTILAMNAAQYLKKHGDAQAEQVCLAADTTLTYFKLCADGKSTPSRKLATRLEQASGGELHRAHLLFPELAEDSAQPAVATG